MSPLAGFKQGDRVASLLANSLPGRLITCNLLAPIGPQWGARLARRPLARSHARPARATRNSGGSSRTICSTSNKRPRFVSLTGSGRLFLFSSRVRFLFVFSSSRLLVARQTKCDRSPISAKLCAAYATNFATRHASHGLCGCARPPPLASCRSRRPVALRVQHLFSAISRHSNCTRRAGAQRTQRALSVSGDTNRQLAAGLGEKSWRRE